MKKLLIIGGSGFVSGTLARRAVAQGHDVTVVTRGERPVPDGVSAIKADRQVPGDLLAALSGGHWDSVLDCIGFRPEDAEQDLGILSGLEARRTSGGPRRMPAASGLEAHPTSSGPRRMPGASGLADHLIFVSTDFVYDPERRQFPQSERDAHYVTEGYGGGKRQAELVLEQSAEKRWTVVRPCHIYGPGSLLGCLPEHSRDKDLIESIRSGQTLRLVGGGHFLQQPIFVEDLADVMLALVGRESAFERILNVRGPDTVESVEYYNIVARALATTAEIAETSVDEFLRENPHRQSFLCHRMYDISALAETGVDLPATPLVEGLRRHVESLL